MWYLFNNLCGILDMRGEKSIKVVFTFLFILYVFFRNSDFIFWIFGYISSKVVTLTIIFWIINAFNKAERLLNEVKEGILAKNNSLSSNKYLPSWDDLCFFIFQWSQNKLFQSYLSCHSLMFLWAVGASWLIFTQDRSNFSTNSLF